MCVVTTEITIQVDLNITSTASSLYDTWFRVLVFTDTKGEYLFPRIFPPNSKRVTGSTCSLLSVEASSRYRRSKIVVGLRDTS
jgi:hypothetical protein